MFEDFPHKIKELLHGLLEFNPNKRMSAYDALQLSLFDSIRRKSLEIRIESAIYLEIDKPGYFDYDLGEDTVFTTKK